MSAIILACSPAECEKIANGDMSILVRKVVPNESNLPIKVYIYCMKSDKYLLDSDCDGSMFCWDKKSHHYPFKFEKDFNELFNGKVIGEFICNEVKKYEPQVILCAYYEVNGADVKENLRYNKGTCLSYDDMVKKSNGKTLYGLHISDLKIYDKPKELSKFNRPCSYAGLCFSCDRAKFTSKGDRICQAMITRPPKNYVYVEE